MKVITTREIARQTKQFFDLAETERVAVKRGKKFVNLIVTEEPDEILLSKKWVEEFLSIPAEFRCDPFEVSPSGDLYFADRRNIEKLIEADKGKTIRLSKEQENALFNDAELDFYEEQLISEFD